MSNKNFNYIPFARKYRPKDFSELLGQEVLVKTLTHCIENNRLASAYLLTGIRGVGKTSSARLIAKTVNCSDLQNRDNKIFPCDKCKNCESFNSQRHPDVIEIDAASKTSVDDIREIIESSEYRPLLGQMKFFIIDEVHMLSKSAFNALLKVVEEPPAHIIFILATTEVQKIPLTVISRCQRYDLRRLTFDEIQQMLKNIATKEQLKIEDEAVKIIAIKSEGSARDATTMLDQAASYVYNATNSSIITAEIIGKMLGLLQTSTIIRFVQLIIANNPAAAIKLLEEIYANANSLEQFIQTMADFMAFLSKSKVITNYHNPLYQTYSNEISDILIGTSLSRLTILWQIFSNGVHDIKQSHNELVTAEMLIIKAIYACNLPSMEEIMDADAGVDISNSTANTTPLKTPSKQLAEQNLEQPAQQEVIQKVPADESMSFEKTAYEFLKYCHSNDEMEMYYMLLNDVEIKEFAGEKMSIAGNITTGVGGKIEKLLKKWSGKDWKVAVAARKTFVSLKDKMLEKVKNTEDYNVIKNNFPEANISDIILKL